MPQFLTRSQLYRLIQRELPQGVYPDSSSPSAFFSTSDSDATAAVMADFYCAQKYTYDNYFPVSATGSNNRLSDHEITYFGYNLSASLTIAQRVAALQAQIQRQPAPTLWTILTLALQYVPQGVPIGIAAYNATGDGANWQLGVSELGINTNLSLNNSDPTQQMENAFGYQVRVFGYTLTAAQYTALDQALDVAEPARSFHVILQDQSLEEYDLVNVQQNINAYSLYRVAYVDPTALETGYTGLSSGSPTSTPLELTDQDGNILITQGGDELVTQY